MCMYNKLFIVPRKLIELEKKEKILFEVLVVLRISKSEIKKIIFSPTVSKPALNKFLKKRKSPFYLEYRRKKNKMKNKTQK